MRKSLIKLQGTSIIEIIAVISIIGVLAAMFMPMVSNYFIRAKISKVLKITGLYKQSVELYYHTYATYPTTLGQLNLSGGAGTNFIDETNGDLPLPETLDRIEFSNNLSNPTITFIMPTTKLSISARNNVNNLTLIYELDVSNTGIYSWSCYFDADSVANYAKYIPASCS